MKKTKIKPWILSIIYGTVSISLVVSLMLLTNNVVSKKESSIKYITTSTINEEVKPVITESKKVIRPYIDDDVVILKNYYDKDSDEEIQKNSLIFYENTYIKNKGIDYGKEEEFNVVSIMDGTVVNVEEDDILGNIVVVEYNDNIVVTYQCIKNINFKVGDLIFQNDIIGVSSSNNISKDIGNHVHIEVTKDGLTINPETLFNEGI